MVKFLLKRFLFMALAVVYSWPGYSMAAETMVLATREETLTNRFAELVLVEAYGRLNINVEFIKYPDARSVIEANNGRTDGEVVRLETVLSQYTNLKKIPVPLFYTELSAFVHEDYEYNISDWDSLGRYSLVAIRGFNFVEQKLAGKLTRIVKTSFEAVKLIEDNRAEVAVLNLFLGKIAIAETKTKHVKAISPPLSRKPTYHLVHKKHEALRPKLTAVLKDMETSGTIKDMWDKFTANELSKLSGK